MKLDFLQSNQTLSTFVHFVHEYIHSFVTPSLLVDEWSVGRYGERMRVIIGNKAIERKKIK